MEIGSISSFSTISVLDTSGRSKMVNTLKKVTHCIFDMDGLLLVSLQTVADEVVQKPCIFYRNYTQRLNDTEHIYQDILRDLVESYGSSYPWETQMKIMGTTEQRTVSVIVNDLNLSCAEEEFLKKYRQRQLTELANARLMRDAERLIRHLSQNNVPIAVATSSGANSVEVKTRNHRHLFDMFNHMVMGSSDAAVREGKPAPDIFLVAAARFPDRPWPEQCLVFEDAPNGVQAAVSAGMQVVMVPDPSIHPELRKQATVVLNSLEDFQPELFGLPAFC